MHGEVLLSVAAKAADAGIVLDVRAVAPCVTKAEAVGMRSRTDLEDEDEFVLGAAEAAQSAIGLVPDAQVLELREDCITRIQQFPHVPPVHAYEGDGAVLR